LKIADLLSIHDSHSSAKGLAHVLGDGFLMGSNPVYRNIRNTALEIGCEFIEAWPQYLLLPFHELNKIVASKKIPFVAHGRMLRELEAKRPGVFAVEEMPMPESYHLHESAHVIAEHLFADFKPDDAREKILKAIMCESFANTTDAMSCVYATDELHRLFLAHNCYMHPQKKAMDTMSRLIRDLGLRFTFMLTFFTYVHANFLREGLAEGLVEDLAARYAPGVELSAKILKDCEYHSRIGERLDPRFRVITTEAYLKLEGHDGDIFEILNFSFMEVFNHNSMFREVIEAMADVIGAGA
jgi:hypothetical protein